VLWGQLPPSEGEVKHIVEQKVDVNEVYRHVAIATPYMDLIDEFTLQEMVSFHFKFKKPLDGMQPTDVLAGIAMPLTGDKHISNFSSGMRQRLKLGLAFYTDSPFLFLDEPSTNLDDRANQWYHHLLDQVKNRVVIIASNQPHEYPTNSERIDILAYK
jgi:ABC-type multidrug transport system ATPase subunit